MKNQINSKEELLIFREVISNALPMVFFTSPFNSLKKVEKASIRYVNKSLLKILGLTEQKAIEIVGKSFKNMIQRLVNSEEAIEKYFNNLIEFQKAEGMELLCQDQKGKKVVIHANSRCIDNNGVWYAQGIFIDKTPEKKLEKEVKTSQKKIKALQTQLSKIHYRDEIVFSSQEMQKVVELATNVADLATTILIQGETGTGKELIAKIIHNRGSRANKPFFAINCGALPESLLESELFGHVKGSFTGAIADRTGYFEAASGGTLFLDEIGELSPATQVKLLRVLEERTVRPLGSNLSVQVNVRIVAATHRNLLEEIQQDNFRDDLYYRIAVLPINIPPLRDRRDDILPLANHFTNFSAQILASPVKGISSQAADRLLTYSWPGNARELQNVIERALILCKEDIIQPSHLLFDLDYARGKLQNNQDEKLNEQSSLKSVEHEEIQKVLRECQGNRSKASKKLGISRSTLWRRLQKIKESGGTSYIPSL